MLSRAGYCGNGYGEMTSTQGEGSVVQSRARIAAALRRPVMVRNSSYGVAVSDPVGLP